MCVCRLGCSAAPSGGCRWAFEHLGYVGDRGGDAGEQRVLDVEVAGVQMPDGVGVDSWFGTQFVAVSTDCHVGGTERVDRCGVYRRAGVRPQQGTGAKVLDTRADPGDLVQVPGAGFRAGLEYSLFVAGPELGADAPVVGAESG